MRMHSRCSLAIAIGASLSLPRAPGIAGMLRDGTAVLGLAFGVAGSAAATIYTVDTTQDPAGPGGTTSLRQALYQANGAANNIVEFAPALNGSTITLQSGEIAVTQPMQITGPGADKLTISGNNASRIFYVAPASGTIAVTITGLTLTAGSTNVFGGAIYARNTQLAMSDAIVSHSAAQYGGGVFCYKGACTFTAVTVSANNAAKGGGLGSFLSPLNAVHSLVSGNIATGVGGGIEVQAANGYTTSSQIVGNTAGSGAGIGSIQSDFTIDQTTISGNTAADYGGGIYATGGGALTITRSLLSGNSAAGAGGGFVFLSAGSLYVKNSTVHGNYGYIYAGGILSKGAADVTIISSTIVANNTGGFAAGNGIEASGSNNYLYSCIVANNFSRGGGLSDLEGDFSLWFSLIKTPDAAVIVKGNGNIDDGTDPQLGPLGVNGGPTLTLMPAAASAVINTGDPSITSGTDQRGVPRVAGGRTDMGAVERQSPEVMIFRNGFDSS